MGLPQLWSKASRPTGEAPSAHFAPKDWPLAPSAKVPRHDPTTPQEEADPSLDKSESGGETSGTHGRGRGIHGCDTTRSTKDITEDPTTRRNPHHCDDNSEPRVTNREELHKRLIPRRRNKRAPGALARRDDRRALEEAPEDDDDTEPLPFATARVHSTVGIRMDTFFTLAQPPAAAPAFPNTTPLRKVTPSKRTGAGLGTSRSRTLPGKTPQTGKLPCPGCNQA
ncbi:hypothetical protein [Streptomyces noursei]